MLSRRTNRRIPAIGIALLAIVALTATACSSSKKAATTQSSSTAATGSSSWDAVVAAAKKEGKLTVWAELSTTVAAAVQAAFHKDYPDIDVTVSSVLPPNLTTKVDADLTSHTNSVDVAWNIERVWIEGHASDGTFKPIIGPDAITANKKLLNGATAIANGAPVSTQILYDNNQALTAIFGAYGFAWNKDAVKTAPTSFQSIVNDPSFKGKIGMADPSANSTTMGLYKLLQNRFPDIFKQLGQLKPQYFASGSLQGQALTSGAVNVTFTVNPSVLGPNAGFAFDTSFPIPGTATFQEVMATAPHPNAAQVFTNWLVGSSAAATLTAGNAFITATGGGSSQLSLKDLQLYEAVPASEFQADIASINSQLGR